MYKNSSFRQRNRGLKSLWTNWMTSLCVVFMTWRTFPQIRSYFRQLALLLFANFRPQFFISCISKNLRLSCLVNINKYKIICSTMYVNKILLDRYALISNTFKVYEICLHFCRCACSITSSCILIGGMESTSKMAAKSTKQSIITLLALVTPHFPAFFLVSLCFPLLHARRDKLEHRSASGAWQTVA